MEKKITDHTTEEEEEPETLWKMIQKEIWTFTQQGDIAVTFSAEKKNASQVKIYDLSFLYKFFFGWNSKKSKDKYPEELVVTNSEFVKGANIWVETRRVIEITAPGCLHAGPASTILHYSVLLQMRVVLEC